MIIARQRLGKHSPRVTLSAIEGYQLLGKGVNKHAFLKTDSEESVFRGVVHEKSFAVEDSRSPARLERVLGSH
jgi:hypothetical protein